MPYARAIRQALPTTLCIEGLQENHDTNKEKNFQMKKWSYESVK
jgi:hypothetical protein